jgi:hypothetical protein
MGARRKDAAPRRARRPLTPDDVVRAGVEMLSDVGLAVFTTRAGMNRLSARLRQLVVVVLCVRVTCTLAENDVAGAPLQGSGEGCVENRPGVPHSADPVSSPL